jgi:hypothetical protein
MLNPSHATAEVDDPTFRRCLSFSQSWEFANKKFGKMTLLNLFAYRATKASELRVAANPVGPENEKHIKKYTRTGFIIVAWGNKGRYFNQDERIITLLNRELHCLGVTKRGCPVHPLYQLKSTVPIPFNPK